MRGCDGELLVPSVCDSTAGREEIDSSYRGAAERGGSRTVGKSGYLLELDAQSEWCWSGQHYIPLNPAHQACWCCIIWICFACCPQIKKTLLLQSINTAMSGNDALVAKRKWLLPGGSFSKPSACFSHCVLLSGDAGREHKRHAGAMSQSTGSFRVQLQQTLLFVHMEKKVVRGYCFLHSFSDHPRGLSVQYTFHTGTRSSPDLFLFSSFFRLPLQAEQFIAQIYGLPPTPPQLACIVMPIAWQIRCTSVC